MNNWNRLVRRRELMWISISGLSLVFGGCSQESDKEKKLRKKLLKFQEMERETRRIMLKKVNKGYEGNPEMPKSGSTTKKPPKR